MAVFAVNQNRQLYVVSAVGSSTSDLTKTGVTVPQVTIDGKNLYFLYKGVTTNLRSDLLEIKSITDASYTTADKMARKFNKFKVVLSNDVNSGAPISGQDYILRIFFSEYIGASEKYSACKYGAVHATASMDASTFYKNLAVSLAKNFSREPSKLLAIYLDGIDGEVTADKKVSDLTGDATGVILEEVEQPWKRGVKKVCAVNFTPYPTTVNYSGDEVVWGEVTNLTSTNSNVLGNGKALADLEYFTAGERGDIYRESGWPNNIDTEYLIDASKTYDTLDIHYYFSGSGINSEKSEKDITFVGDTTSIKSLCAYLKAQGVTPTNYDE